MSFKKNYRGHYCKVCGHIRPNEKFSGKGHKNHICKICSKIPVSQQAEKTIINNLYRLYKYPDLSRNNKSLLKKYLNDPRENIKKAAIEIWESFTRSPMEYEYDENTVYYLYNTDEQNLKKENASVKEIEEIPF